MTVTVKGGMWNDIGSDQYALLTKHAPTLSNVKVALNKQGTIEEKAIINKLAANAVGAGGNVLVKRKRVSAVDGEEFGAGGAVEEVTLINRATTTADRDEVLSITASRGISTYPVNKDGAILGAQV